MTVTRFVILHHRERAGEHWDLMIEQEGGLATWRLARMPTPGDATPIAATQLGLHRKAYLTYEGRLSGDRGEVARVEAGACEILERREGRWCIRLAGALLAEEYALEQQSGDAWTFVGI